MKQPVTTTTAAWANLRDGLDPETVFANPDATTREREIALMRLKLREEAPAVTFTPSRDGQALDSHASACPPPPYSILLSSICDLFLLHCVHRPEPYINTRPRRWMRSQNGPLNVTTVLEMTANPTNARHAHARDNGSIGLPIPPAKNENSYPAPVELTSMI